MSSNALFLGIDLGTTNSAAAVFDGTTLSVVRSADGSNITPSVVRLDARGRVTVGERARRLRDSDPENVRGEFKRLLGTAHAVDFPAAKRSLRPEELSAEVLKSLREDVRQQYGFAPESAVITVPALFELPQTTATAEAARAAGFARVELLQEPVASAIVAGWKADADDPAPWLVYDLGGGTFDVSLLETQDGMLRVVGHDGDNFLGGRDFDSAVCDWAVGELARSGDIELRRDDPRHATALRRLRAACEEARIELTRSAEAAITLPALSTGDQTADVDLTLTRPVCELLLLPLVERSIAVCRRLLERHGLSQAKLSRVVLVGGPTATPLLRRRVAEQLGTTLGEGLDPMTLVAQGAALYAASANLDARPREKVALPSGPRVWLQYPAMSSDLAPWVVGRFVEGEKIAAVSLRRDDDSWQSNPEALDAEGTFAVPVQLEARKANTFLVEGVREDGSRLSLTPASITIVHGVNIGDPPLPRAVGVALAGGGVQVFFERGSPLPMRRTHRLRTVETVSKGAAGFALDVPIVQGDFPLAHLCRLVGTLRIPAEKVTSTLPADSAVEVTLELDRGGRLQASARVPSLNQVFDEVAVLVAPKVSAAELRANLQTLRDRAAEAQGALFRSGNAKAMSQFARVDGLFAELERDLAAADGGDVDALERARRTQLDLDGLLAGAEADRAWPELIESARRRLAWALGWVGQYGTDAEKKSIEGVAAALEKAVTARNAADVTRQQSLASQLGHAAYYRSPGVWDHELDALEGLLDTMRDVPKGQRLIREGRQAQGRGDAKAVESACRELWKLLPPDASARKQSFGSGLR
ncbi:MAG: Hsp70 family protein [Polyangiales bacterium]